MNKVQLSLTNEEVAILSSFGSQFGYSLPKTIRFVISRSVEEFVDKGLVPEFPMSEATEKIGQLALAEHQSGLTKKIDSISDFMNQL